VLTVAKVGAAVVFTDGLMVTGERFGRSIDLPRRIRELAAENQVPLVEAPPLARALYRGCALEDEIPAGLYQAVAQVLSYVYQLRELRRGDYCRGKTQTASRGRYSALHLLSLH